MNDLLKRIYSHPWVELIVRWLLGASFIYASYHKIVEPERFAEAVYSYDLFPHFTINLIAVILPWIELCAGLCLFVGIYYRGAALLMGGMLLAFIAALTINLVRGHEFDCGCFSVSETGVHDAVELMLFRDTVLWCFAMYVLFFDKKRRWCVQHRVVRRELP